MKSQILLTVWCNISGGAGGEIWHWSLSGVKGLMVGRMYSLGVKGWKDWWGICEEFEKNEEDREEKCEQANKIRSWKSGNTVPG